MLGRILNVYKVNVGWLSHNKCNIFKASVSSVVMFGCETLRQTDKRWVDALKLCIWRWLLNVPWTTGKKNNNQLLTKERLTMLLNWGLANRNYKFWTCDINVRMVRDRYFCVCVCLLCLNRELEGCCYGLDEWDQRDYRNVHGKTIRHYRLIMVMNICP